jgi:serine/threonine protein kinase
MDFVAGCKLARTLGEGAYGEAKLLINRSSGEKVAMKKHSNAHSNVHREVCIQRVVTHPHIVRFYANHREGNFEYIFPSFYQENSLTA